MEFSIILTGAREARTITKAIDCIADPEYSGVNWENGELIIVAPDLETLKTAQDHLQQHYPKVKVQFLQDPYQGKPTALNLAFEKASGKILILTDADVFLGKRAIALLLAPFASDPKIGGVVGRPQALQNKSTFWGYIGNLLADAAHHKRVATMRPDIGGRSLHLVSKEPQFFVMSGYISAIRNLDFKMPKETLVDDAYLSYLLVNKGYRITYIPEATVSVKYPTNIRDWYTQKVRSVGGYMQLHKFGIVPPDKKVRNFWKELEYAWFPIRYASNVKEFFWSILLYPLRFWMWLRIFWDQKIRKKDFFQVWTRVESTK